MTQIVKNQSFALANILSRFGISIRHSIALEVMAQLNGTKDWNVYAAKGSEPKVRTEMEEQLLLQLKSQYLETYGPLKEGETVRLACAADRLGNLRLMERLAPGVPYRELGAKVRLGLERKFDSTGPAWELFVFVSFTNENGEHVVTDYSTLSKAELHNQTFSITLKKRGAEFGVGVCPLTAVLHSSSMSVYAFVDGSEYPLYEGIVPKRVWDVAQMIVWDSPETPSRYTDGTQVTVTVGEVVDCFKRYTAERSLNA